MVILQVVTMKVDTLDLPLLHHTNPEELPKDLTTSHRNSKVNTPMAKANHNLNTVPNNHMADLKLQLLHMVDRLLPNTAHLLLNRNMEPLLLLDK